MSTGLEGLSIHTWAVSGLSKRAITPRLPLQKNSSGLGFRALVTFTQCPASSWYSIWYAPVTIDPTVRTPIVWPTGFSRPQPSPSTVGFSVPYGTKLPAALSRFAMVTSSGPTKIHALGIFAGSS